MLVTSTFSPFLKCFRRPFSGVVKTRAYLVKGRLDLHHIMSEILVFFSTITYSKTMMD